MGINNKKFIGFHISLVEKKFCDFGVPIFHAT